MTSRAVFAAVLLIRPILILPMAPSGPLGGSDLLPLGLLVVFAAHGMLAAGVVAGVRVLVAVALVTAVLAVPVALVGIVAGLPMPWPMILAGYNVLVVAVGVQTWREQADRP